MFLRNVNTSFILSFITQVVVTADNSNENTLPTNHSNNQWSVSFIMGMSLLIVGTIIFFIKDIFNTPKSEKDWGIESIAWIKEEFLHFKGSLYRWERERIYQNAKDRLLVEDVSEEMASRIISKVKFIIESEKSTSQAITPDEVKLSMRMGSGSVRQRSLFPSVLAEAAIEQNRKYAQVRSKS